MMNLLLPNLPPLLMRPGSAAAHAKGVQRQAWLHAGALSLLVLALLLFCDPAAAQLPPPPIPNGGFPPVPGSTPGGLPGLHGHVSSAGATVYEALKHFESQYPAFYQLINIFCWLAGFWTLAGSISHISRVSESRGVEVALHTRTAFIWLVISVLLLNSALFFGSLTQSMALGGSNLFSYATDGGMQEQGKGVLSPVVHFVNFIGLIAAIYGIFQLKRLGRYGNHDRVLQRAVIFIVSGVMALNIVTFMKMLAHTFGWEVMLQLIDKGFVS